MATNIDIIYGILTNNIKKKRREVFTKRKNQCHLL